MRRVLLTLLTAVILTACTTVDPGKNASDIFNNSNYRAMSYGGYRATTRENVPSINDIKEDLLLLEAMDIKIIRTYDTGLGQTPNLLEAIRELKNEKPGFEMYVMMGAWIDAANARTAEVDHSRGDTQANYSEIMRAVNYTNKYPDIVKAIAVGNEAMVHWQCSYWVTPTVILHWVSYLQNLKKNGEIPSGTWITSSDNFASWGGDEEYQTASLDSLIAAVDFISMHSYPYHDTHYNNKFWKDAHGNIDTAMNASLNHTLEQYDAVKNYMQKLGYNKPVVVGETGWASVDNTICGPDGSGASDEYKQAIYHKLIRDWSDRNNITCFYFEAFDEPWKDAINVNGSENHFGLIDINGHVKYALWDLFDEGKFDNLSRGGKKITKSFDGNMYKLMETVVAPK